MKSTPKKEKIELNRNVNFKRKVWFSRSQFAEWGVLLGYCEKTKLCRVLTKYGYCKIDLSDIAD